MEQEKTWYIVGDDAFQASVCRLFWGWSEKPSHRGKRLETELCLIMLYEFRCSLPWALAGNVSKLLTQHFLIPEYLKNKSHFSPDCRKQPFWPPALRGFIVRWSCVIQPMQKICYFYYKRFRRDFPESSCGSLDCRHVTQNRTTVWIMARCPWIIWYQGINELCRHLRLPPLPFPSSSTVARCHLIQSVFP